MGVLECLDRDIELDADNDVISFHRSMAGKGPAFYGVAVKPCREQSSEIKLALECILQNNGYAPKVMQIRGYLVIDGEYSSAAMSDLKRYLESIEGRLPSVPVMVNGDYFQMAALKWLDDVLKSESGELPHKL